MIEDREAAEFIGELDNQEELLKQRQERIQ